MEFPFSDFLFTLLATGFEGGSRFARAKRFALRAWEMKSLTAKDDVDNVGAGRTAKGEIPVASTKTGSAKWHCPFWLSDGCEKPRIAVGKSRKKQNRDS